MRRLRPAIFSVLTLATLAGIVFAVGLIFGAWEVGGSSGKPSQEPANEVTRERDGVTMKLTVDKEKYGPGDPVKVNLTISNTTDRPVDYRGKTPDQRGFVMDIGSDLVGDQPATDATPEDMSGTLKPGAKLERQTEWDQKLAVEETPVVAPPGRYSVTAKLLIWKPGFAEAGELAGAVTFEIEGTPYVQPPLDALRAVLKDQQVKAWASGRGDTVICAYPTRHYFYNGSLSTAAAAETFDFLYTSQTDNGQPICGIATDGDAWRFVLFSPKGEEPHRLTVWVALDEPVVRRVAEGGPTPEPSAAP